MSESEDIPEDIQREAYLVVRDLSGIGAYAGREAWENIVARALMSERNRCARIAEGAAEMDQLIARVIAAAIRSPTGEAGT